MNVNFPLAQPRFAVILAFTIGSSLLAADDPPDAAAKSTKKVNLGQVAKHGDTALAEGYTVIGEGAPGIGFGLSQKGREKVQISYFVIFKNDYTSTESKTGFTHAVQGRRGLFQATYTTQVNDATLTIMHQIGGGKGELLSVCGETFQPAKGRVFLVDLTAKRPAVQQLKLALPAQAAKQDRKESDVETIAEDVLAEIVKKDETVRKFVAPAAP